MSVIGCLLGLGYTLLKKTNYTATCTFVLEDEKSSGLGQFSGIASLAGINLNGDGGGVFQGDNIIELYKSRTMIEKTFLTYCIFNGKRELLIDRYIDSYHLREEWKKNLSIKNINFDGNVDKFSRKQDSIVTDLVDLFNKKVLNVTKPDKKLSIINVQVTTEDEMFSKFFTETLVQNVNDFYVQTRVKKQAQSVQILQRQADSVKNMLNSSIHGVASAIDADPNANPLMSTLREGSQRKQIDVQANSAIYSEIVKNLELAKIALLQETPLIQIIDKPVMPLVSDHGGKLKSIFLGTFSGFFLSIILIFCIRIFKFFLTYK